MSLDLRPASALQLLHGITLSLVRETRPEGLADLSMRQTTILLIVYLEPPPHTVRGLAAKLGVTKPVITRALDSMGKAGLLSRRRDEVDKRNVIIQRTVKGALYIEKIADMITLKGSQLPTGPTHP